MLKYLVGKMAKNSFENYPFCFVQTTEPIVPRHSHDGINVEKIFEDKYLKLDNKLNSIYKLLFYLHSLNIIYKFGNRKHAWGLQRKRIDYLLVVLRLFFFNCPPAQARYTSSELQNTANLC